MNLMFLSCLAHAQGISSCNGQEFLDHNMDVGFEEGKFLHNDN